MLNKYFQWKFEQWGWREGSESTALVLPEDSGLAQHGGSQ